jgi:hypothetical protein
MPKNVSGGLIKNNFAENQDISHFWKKNSVWTIRKTISILLERTGRNKETFR